jgi:bromodomain and WD repeat domain-containing protein 1/3
MEYGLILNIFKERGIHINYPNFQVPILDGLWCNDGRSFALSTDFGSFSIYGYGNSDIYDRTYMEQFYLTDNELFLVNQ